MSLTTCPYFSVTYPVTATCGAFTACPGQIVTASNCDTCIGDTVMSLLDASGTEVWDGDDGCSFGTTYNYCTYLSYEVPPDVPCQDYSLVQGCYNGYTCSATTKVSVNTPTPTAAPSIAPKAYVQYFQNVDCSGSTAGVAVVDSNACNAFQDSTFFALEVKCPSNSPNATWIANSYFDQTCSSSSYQTNSGNGGGCNECVYVQNSGYSYKVNCGPELAPGCSAPPSAVPSPGPPTLEPTLPNPTAAPSKGVEAYVKYYYGVSCDDTWDYIGGQTVDSGACTAYPGNTYALEVQCETNTPDSAWTAQGFFDDDLTCTAQGFYMYYSGTGPCACTPLGGTYASVKINCGGTPVDCTSPPTADPTPDPTPVTTIAPSKGIEAYVQYFGYNECFSSAMGTVVVDSGACITPMYYSYARYTVECESNSPDSAWTARIYSGTYSCSGSVYQTISGSGACECQQFYDTYSFAVNCGDQPMLCSAPPTVAPTSAAPVAPTPQPSQGVEAYVKYFFDSTCSGQPYEGFVVDSGACNNNWPWTTLQVNCASDSVDSAWTAYVYNNDYYDTCDIPSSQTLTGSGPCGVCTYVPTLGYYVVINCSGTDGCPAEPVPDPTIAPTEVREVGAYVTVFQDRTCSSGYTAGDRLPLKKCVRLGYSGVYGNFTCDSLSAASNWTSQVYADSTCSTFLQTIEGGSACDCFSFNGANSRGYSIEINCNGAEELSCPTPQPTPQPTYGPQAALTLYGSNTCSTSAGSGASSVSLNECHYLQNGVYASFTCESLSTLSPWAAKLYSDSSCAGTPVQTIQGADSCDCLSYKGNNSMGHGAQLNCAGWNAPRQQCPATGGGYMQVYQSSTCTGNSGGSNAPLKTCIKMGYSGFYGNFSCDSRSSSSSWSVNVYTDSSCSFPAGTPSFQGGDACECFTMGDSGYQGWSATMNCAGGAPAQCFPTALPSVQPSVRPTDVPVAGSTVQPSALQSVAPNAQPSVAPTSTRAPVAIPTMWPSAQPVFPTVQPSKGIEAYVKFFYSYDPTCSADPKVAQAVDSGACNRYEGWSTVEVNCQSNSADSSWTAEIFGVDIPGTCAAEPFQTITGSGPCGVCTYVPNLNEYVEINCGGIDACALVPSANPTAMPSGYLTVYDSDSCSGDSGGVSVPLDFCVPLSASGLYAIFSCDSLSSSSAWTASVYWSNNCQTDAVNTIQGANSGDCFVADGDYVAGYSLTMNCGGTDTRASASSSGMSSAEVGGIVGGVVGGLVLIGVAVGLWAFGAFSVGASAGAASAGGAAAGGAAGSSAGGAASATADVEMATTTINPIAPPTV